MMLGLAMRWRISGKRRARLRRYLAGAQGGGTVVWDGVAILWAPCVYCHWAQPVQLLTLDHIVPRSMEGTSHWSNMVLACRECNVKKGSLRIEEFLEGPAFRNGADPRDYAGVRKT